MSFLLKCVPISPKWINIWVEMPLLQTWHELTQQATLPESVRWKILPFGIGQAAWISLPTASSSTASLANFPSWRQLAQYDSHFKMSYQLVYGGCQSWKYPHCCCCCWWCCFCCSLSSSSSFSSCIPSSSVGHIAGPYQGPLFVLYPPLAEFVESSWILSTNYF